MTTTNEGTQRDELAQIKARLEAATPGPWTPQEYDDNPGDQGVPIIGGGELGSMQGHLVAYAMTLSDEAQCEADGDFIAHARTDIPKLVAALEAVEAYIVTQEARTAFPDASRIDKAYSLGRRHSYEAIRAEITEALA